MTLFRSTFIWTLVLIVAVAAGASVASAQSRTVGEVIDDTSITAEVKAKLAADRLSSLTQIGVNTRNRIVTLTGTVDSLERQARAAQIAVAVKGVRGVVNDVQVASAANAPPPPVASVPDQPVGAVQPNDWRMGTVWSVDRATSQIVLTDGTVVRLSPAVNIRHGPERLTLEQIVPGSEVVIRPMAPSPTATAEGSALPGRIGTPAVIDAAEINVAWTPVSGPR